MNISSISATDSIERRNLFIQYANQFMSFKARPESTDEIFGTTPVTQPVQKHDKDMGIETLTIFPKEVINGRTIITA